MAQTCWNYAHLTIHILFNIVYLTLSGISEKQIMYNPCVGSNGSGMPIQPNLAQLNGSGVGATF